MDFKTKSFVLKTVFIYDNCMCEESVRTRETGHDIDIHIEICIFHMNVCE